MVWLSCPSCNIWTLEVSAAFACWTGRMISFIAFFLATRQPIISWEHFLQMGSVIIIIIFNKCTQEHEMLSFCQLFSRLLSNCFVEYQCSFIVMYISLHHIINRTFAQFTRHAWEGVGFGVTAIPGCMVWRNDQRREFLETVQLSPAHRRIICYSRESEEFKLRKKKKKDGGTITANYENQSHLNADFGFCDTHTDSAMPRCASILPLPRPFYSIWSSLLTRSPTRTRSVPLFGSCEHTRNSSGQDGRRSFLFARRRSSSWWILFTSLCETSTRELTHSTEAIDAHCPDRPKKKKVSFFLTFFC